MEKEFVCEFFADMDGELPLSAREAQSLIEQDPQVALYHKVCVIRGASI